MRRYRKIGVYTVRPDYSEDVLNDRGFNLHDDLAVLDLFDAAVPPDGLMSADPGRSWKPDLRTGPAYVASRLPGARANES